MNNKRVSAVARLAISAAFLAGTAASSLGLAQNAPKSWVASPDVYKVVGESDKFRIVRATWQPGQRDKPHSHKPSGTYFMTDCHMRIYEGGKTREAKLKGGRAFIHQKPVKEHSLENIGSTVCDLVFFEEK